MSSYTIAMNQLNIDEVKRIYVAAKNEINPTIDWSDLNVIFEIALQTPSLFPKINLNKENQTSSAYIRQWVHRYYNAYMNKPSFRIASQNTTCPDPAINSMIAYKLSISPQSISTLLFYHRLFMSAENIQGNLLEEYIAKKITPYGFIWCQGDILHAVDFCNRDGTFLLQVKNKYNTENSSSSNIREGTPIKKWHRLDVKTISGNKVPKYKWGELNMLIDSYNISYNSPPCDMSEEEYIAFLMDSIRKNPNLITA